MHNFLGSISFNRDTGEIFIKRKVGEGKGGEWFDLHICLVQNMKGEEGRDFNYKQVWFTMEGEVF
jgi:hypothetical protein